MKQLFYFFAFSLLIAFSACARDKECHIIGRVTSPDLEGKMIFLVPMTNADSTNVDSIAIKDGKFEFHTKRHELRKILVDYHFRIDTQPLLVVCEPGTVQAIVGSTSSATGTTNNDALQRWKEKTELYQFKTQPVSKLYYEARQQKDSVAMSKYQATLTTMREDYTRETKELAATLNDGPLKEFFDKMYPQETGNKAK